MATDPIWTKRLTAGGDLAELQAATPSAPPQPSTKPIPWRPAPRNDQPPALSCQQTLTLSFFFDGTGNNLDADVGTFEHSNVARLYRAHLEDSDGLGRFRFYLPGLGTYFMDREVKDPGGTVFGRAFADMGQARLNWAFARMNEKIRDAEARAENPTNKICWIKVSAFGFSRGAALARAFCRDLQARCHLAGDTPLGWRLKQGSHPIEITFLGLFETVASSGLPPSSNNLHRNRYVRSAEWLNPLEKLGRELIETPELKRLAFGNMPGADPAPGFYDGHGGWADGLALGAMTKQCLHLIAGHETRNSFALDTTLLQQRPNFFGLPNGCTEMVYPGVHSDVGGGYRPGEGGCSAERGAQLSLIPLRTMHERAIAVGVPLVALGGLSGAERQDFAVDKGSVEPFAKMVALWNDYRAYVGRYRIPGAVDSLGLVLNQHMRAFYAWRFYAIKLKLADRAAGRPSQYETRVTLHEQTFASDRARIDNELKAAGAELFNAQNRQEVARIQLESARMSEARLGTPPDPQAERRLELASRETERRQVVFDRVRARKETAADDRGLNMATARYDQMLMQQVQQIVAWMRADKTLRLRPHYYALVDAYLDEFERHQGLRDRNVIEFFTDYVHDSLAGFDADETWPSDPRIVYVGSDNRLRYAGNNAPREIQETLPA